MLRRTISGSVCRTAGPLRGPTGAAAGAVSLIVCALIWAQVGVNAETPPSPDPATAPTSEPEPAPGRVSDEVLVNSGAVIGEIVIRAKPIFDTESGDENRRFFRIANRLHHRTRDATIRRVLLFESGDPFSRRALEESERALRQCRYLYDAEVEVLRYEDDAVDVSVETRDVWTLGGGVSFGRSGGTNHSRIGIEERNLLGLGKGIQFKQTSDVDRTSTRLRYLDSNLFGGRSTLALSYSSNSDGQEQRFDLGRPFVSLDSRVSGGIRWDSYERIDAHYVRGHIGDQYRHTGRMAELYGGLSQGLRNGHAVRFRAGLTLLEDLFSRESRTVLPLPDGRTLVYPWVEWSTVQDRFIETSDLDMIQRTEDFNLGRQARLRLGYASRGLGSDRDQGILEAGYSAGYVPGANQIMLVTAQAQGRFGATRNENVVLSAGVRYLLRDWNANVLALSLSGDAASGLDAENQLTLGGDNGLRGYPLRYQDGDRRVLFTIEQRFYTDWHLMKLLHVGAAVFADVGQAWFRGAGHPEIEGARALRDVGAGIRLGSSRSARGSMIRLDVAFPLDGDASISRMQFLVSTGERF